MPHPGNGLSPTLSILSWNINGIRTTKNLKETLDSLKADIICLQETKVTRDMIDEPTAIVDGYNAYFSFSRTRSGYSGVATYCREHATPLHAEEGLGGTLKNNSDSDIIGCYDDIESEFSLQELKSLDAEGRTVITQHQIEDAKGSSGVLTIFNVYCPRADPERPDRLEYKLRFYHLLQLRATAVRTSGSHVVIVGDVNTSHQHIDRCEVIPQDEFEANPGRRWMNSFVHNSQVKDQDEFLSEKGNFRVIDSFRYFHPNQEGAYTCWNTQINARAANYGSRIDYILVDRVLIHSMLDSVVLSDVLGSDHCPVAGFFNVRILKPVKCPSLCIKNFPEFSGVQQKLSSFFVKKTAQGCQQESEESEGFFLKRPRMDMNGLETQKAGLKKTSASKTLNQKGIMNFFQKTSSVEKNSVSDEAIFSSQESFSGHSSQESSSSSGSMGSDAISFSSLDCDTTVKKGEKPSGAVSAWRSMLTGPRPAPLCKGHKEPCVQRTVKKKGPNFNRIFYACARGEGSKNDPRARCDHFEWAFKK